MKASLFLGLVGSGSVLADFDIWRGVNRGRSYWYLSETDHTPTDTEITSGRTWNAFLGDSRPGQFGISCEDDPQPFADSCGASFEIYINKLEIYLSDEPLYHWTLSNHKNGRGWLMIGLDGEEYASCITSGDIGYTYRDANGGGVANAFRKFTCNSTLTAGQLNQQ